MCPPTSPTERQRRWRLVLGPDAEEALPEVLPPGADREMDQTLQAVYAGDRKGTLTNSSPRIARWLGDIRKYFPATVVQVIQQDALERLALDKLLLEPELLASLEPDVHLLGMLMALREALPERTHDTARALVARVVADLERRLREPLVQSLTGALNRTARTRRPRHSEIDWPRTLRANLRFYQPEYGTILPVHRYGYGRARRSLRDVVLCVDQSGSMAASLVWSGIVASVMAQVSALRTRLVVFDTSVVDLTDRLDDPVELLFSLQLGGGTDIHRALSYCRSRVQSPMETVLILISDLHEGGPAGPLLRTAAELVASGVQLIVLLALSDEGAPAWESDTAQELAEMGVPAFACTPDAFPEMMAAALQREDLRLWASARGLAVAGGRTHWQS